MLPILTKSQNVQRFGVSAYIGKKIKGDNDSAIREHLLINRDHLPLNNNRRSLPLEISDNGNL